MEDELYTVNDNDFQMKSDETLEPARPRKRGRPRLSEFYYSKLLNLYDDAFETEEDAENQHDSPQDEANDKDSVAESVKFDQDCDDVATNNPSSPLTNEGSTSNVDTGANDTRFTSSSDQLNSNYDAIDETIDNYESTDGANTEFYYGGLAHEANASDVGLAKELPPPKIAVHHDNHVYVISEELRQYYIRQSKLLPKIRGVWFNSTVRRMGWVGQAYKKCKRIEKIFSISKHGFEGARKMAIAFRNSQKPTGKSPAVTNYPDVTINDVIKPISQIKYKLYNAPAAGKDPKLDLAEAPKAPVAVREPAPDAFKRFAYEPKQPLAPAEPAITLVPLNRDLGQDSYVYDVNYGDIVENYKSELNRDQKVARDNFCKEALLFMLYELEALVELDFPVPPVPKPTCKKGISFHINLIQNSKSAAEILPYINYLAYYICNGITPTDIPHTELYPLIKILSYCSPLKC